MSVSRGKQFEDVVKDCIQNLGDVHILRLYDPQGGYASVANPCDFVAYKRPQSYMIECKSKHKNLLSIYSPCTNPKDSPYGDISKTQWEGMLKATEYGVVAGVLCWWVDKDVTKFLPIQELEAYRNSGAKSIRYDYELPNSLIIKGDKKRVFFNYDFSEFFQKYC